MLDDLRQDARLAVRRLIRAPLFCLTAVSVLALGIGANTAVFSLLNAVVLRSLPVSDPDRLVAVSRVNASGQRRFMPVALVAEFARRQNVFDSLAAYTSGPTLTVEARGLLAWATTEFVDEAYYSVLGVQPLHGRLIGAADRPAAADAELVVVLSFRFWQQRLGGDPAVVGRILRVESVPLTIIGITPPEFGGLQASNSADIVAPIAILGRFVTPDVNRRPGDVVYIIGRLGRGITLRQARAHVEALWPAVQEATVPQGLTDEQLRDAQALRPHVEPAGSGFSSLRTGLSPTLYLLVALTALLLLLTCANLAGLLTVRAATRHRELAVRTALGASRRRLIQPMLIESLLIAVSGTLVAVPCAWWTSRLLGAALWAGTPVTLAPTPDRRVLVVAAMVALLVGSACGLVPAFVATSRMSRIGADNAWSAMRGHTARGPRMLLVCQIAVSLTLLFGAVLLTRSLVRLWGIDRGFDSRGVVIVRVGVQPGAYRQMTAATYYPELVRRLSEIPGTERVSLARQFTYVFNSNAPQQTVAFPGGGVASAEIGATIDAVSPGFFETMRIPVMHGRDFAWSDDGRAPPVVVVNARFAREAFGEQSPIGQHIGIGNDLALRDVTIVGVVGDARFWNLRRELPMVYRSWLQAGAYGRFPIIQLRTTIDPAHVREAIESTVSALGVEFVTEIRTVDAQIDNALGRERVAAALAAIFGALASVLAFLGIYGLLAYAVQQRTREIGVRMALGATRQAVVRMITSEGVAITVAGVALGVPLALSVGRLAAALLYGVTPFDALALIAAATGLLVTGFIAGLVPALRAINVPPMDALRSE